jgi:hypothetical protein
VRFVVVLACLAAGACAPANVVLRSNHYRVFVPSAWRVAEQSGGAEEPTVLRVPAASTAKPGDTLELRLYAWPAPAGVADPVSEATRLLAGRQQAEMQSAAAADEGRCGALTHGYWLFGKPQRAAHLRVGSGQHLIVTAGQAAGSLVAAVGYVRDEPPFCDNMAALDAALGALRGSLADSGDLARVPDPEIILPGSSIQHLSVALPTPEQPLLLP